MGYDVAIVGCGPVGGVLAGLLGRAGRSVVVLERHEARYPLPRAVHFDHEVARILQACGLGAELAGLSEPAPDYVWRNGTGDVLLHFGGRDVGPSGWPVSNMFCQPALEERIEAVAGALPTVEVRRGVEVTGIEHLPDGTVEVAAGGASGPEVVGARFVVGCDGANSVVRGLMGAAAVDLGYFFDWLIVDVVLHEPRRFDPVNLQVCDPARPTSAVSGGPGRRRWEFMRLPQESVAELDREDRAWALLEPWDVHPGNATLERHTVYRFHARWADRWRSGPVLLAGDAAHLMPPFAGQGMCSGIRDAANLAWKLDLVLSGHAPDTLLDAYQTEREANVRAVVDFSMALGRVICVTDPAEAAARDASMTRASGALAPVPPLPGIDAGIVLDGDPHAGALFVQGRVAAADGVTRLLDDVVGAGWRLLTLGVAPPAVDDELGRWFRTIGGDVVALDPADDVDGTYGRWFDDHPCHAVLQRPDLHVYGTAATVDDVGPLLASLRAALGLPTPATTSGGDPP